MPDTDPFLTTIPEIDLLAMISARLDALLATFTAAVPADL